MADFSADKPCFYFQRGECKYGDRCRLSHRPNPTSRAPYRQPCPYLRTPRGCSKGQHCKFSHETVADKNDARTQAPRSTARSRSRSEWETGFREWTFLIQRQHTPARIADIERFFKLGWNLVSKEHTETGQQIIKKLATDEGLAMVKALVDEQVAGFEVERTMMRVFKESTLPFFRTITSPNILSSLILETPLDTICGFLFGPNGRRAIKLFKATTSALVVLARNETAEQEGLTLIAVAASLVILERIVELNQSAQVITELTSIVNDLSTSIPKTALQAGDRSLVRIRQRLGLGTAMPMSGSRLAEHKSHRSVFNLGQDLPGSLSKLGPRHDNDHADIFEIKILPTTEEIQSHRQEYLPLNDSTQLHLPGLAGLLDRQFRLLREDTVGQLRDAVQIEYKRLSKGPSAPPPPQRQTNGVRNIVYHKVVLLRVEFDRNKGLQVVAEFDQPAVLAKKGSKEREDWWMNSKHLQIDAFVCLVSSTGRAIFFSVCDPTPRPRPERRNSEEEQKSRVADHSRASNERPSLFTHADRATLMLSMVEDNSEDITWINSHLGKAHTVQQSLVEFPGILLASFRPTLQALQKMSRTLDLPFSQFIAPDEQSAEDVDVPPPTYSRRPGFTFNLETLTGGEPLSLIPGQPFDDRVLREKSTLDKAQQMSTINSLRSCLALVQGPPGTGKSHLGVTLIKALLKNRDAAELGPIICVCYTNHALDQLLENLIKDGVEQVIRLGSRSKSELVQKLNLHHVSKDVMPTKFERYEKYKLYEELDTVLNEIAELMTCLRDPARWSNVKDYLEAHHEDHFSRLFGRGVDEHGFQEIRGKKWNVLHSWLKGAPKRITSARPISELVKVDLMEMSGIERSALHKYWIQRSTMELNQRLLHVLESYRHLRSSLQKYHQEIDLRCLLGAHVIGVTTTGLARQLEVLHRLRAKVVVVEEAGEVLEAHTLTALLPSVEHAILIGDHEQLRPQINNYDFQHDSDKGAKFSLDISLFERLVHPQPGHPKLPHNSLNVQRRMHPSIAELVKSTLYPKLQDHPTVFDHPKVDGMRKRLFWLDHNHMEDAASANSAYSLSKTNAWEVEMVAALVSHLVRQGTYRNEDIAVLTPYLGQLQKLKQHLGSSFAIVVDDRDLDKLEAEGVEDDNVQGGGVVQGLVRKTTLLNALRIATVDNFQGEEAKIVIISLVRSNAERRCGFLKTSNRINVLLSRARHGMYIIGNTQTARPVPMWNKVITMLENGGNVGQSLALCCPRHKETPIEVSKPDDFSVFSPEETRSCQKCADKSVKNMMVDYITWSTYSEIDLDKNPCIIPTCGHILTQESMDALMEMPKYYTFSEAPGAENSIIALKSSSVPFSTSELKSCPLCRLPLRNINRYGRIVRRAWIDEATKKFIVWANSRFVPLASSIEQAEEKFRAPVTERKTPKHTLRGQTQLSSAVDERSLESIRLIGSRDEQIRVVFKIFHNDARYKDIFPLRNAIRKFLHEVDEREQPISRIHDLVRDARKHHPGSTEIATDLPSVLQVRNRLLATILLLRCDYAILLDFITQGVPMLAASPNNPPGLHLNLASNRQDCERLIQESRTRQQPSHEVEGLLYWARFVALERRSSGSPSSSRGPPAGNKTTPTDMTALVNLAAANLHRARTICTTHSSQTAGMLAEIVDVEKMLRDPTFYAPVTNSEKAAVYAAMAQSFSGTGHWYYCANGHPFTVGECGMPVETSRCPQCGAPVGGRNHVAVAGVRRAVDLEEQFGRGRGR
ncbi:hypothetical protein EPUS_05226 [Endocarpon pusillum Z07020]|uniref:NFX1-type zinc finger-containing protein 1 n=1 Tax=Endocarpon pusillum (strain Z07020 / HMAS-L-300199) TaxID=1263415 RepID=U1FZN5_ENDPU|nr:uncharacterized protein EPUS_05226 [Endocarpon pusillum Z07020]ERF70407.1 hypothetical protein EPUS_05226 [Endocarpon pusillum Z07020]